ncbi:hypothetical protein [Telmatospirillum sp.]|uniref:hypothetical protein n=1 Tax=Telmatospirillum sp. TaxID=2079197 RepID=UPI0028494352|nr:hypothetical protein [Telmatospirillum sp.]MDR3438723.1 hypothetical protein [Telmatospirillum sp.]
MVGLHASGQSGAGNVTGRAWEINTNAHAVSGADGGLAAAEIDVINSGSDQVNFDQPTTKTGVSAIAMGTSPSTAAFVASGGSSTWHGG